MLTRVGEFPPLFFSFFFYNGYLQGASLGVSGPVMAGRVFGIAVSDTAHVSVVPLIQFRAVNVCGFFVSVCGGCEIPG